MPEDNIKKEIKVGFSTGFVFNIVGTHEVQRRRGKVSRNDSRNPCPRAYTGSMKPSMSTMGAELVRVVLMVPKKPCFNFSEVVH